MVVQFNQIPDNLRVPFFFAEVNPGQSPYQSIARLLLIGQKTAAGVATANEPIFVRGDTDGLFGPGSMIGEMWETAKRNAPFQEIWCLPLDDAAGATAAAGTVTVANLPVTQSQNIIFYVAGIRLAVVATIADTDATLATKIADEINAELSLPVTAAAVGAVVTATAKNGGTIGNSIRIETALSVDDSLAADQYLTIVQPNGGAGDIDLATAFATLGSEEYDWVAAPYNQVADLDAARDFLDGVSGRWSPFQQLYGHYITARPDTVGSLSALGNLRNDPHSSVMATYNSPTPSWIWAAAIGAQAAQHLQSAPELSRPLQTLILRDVRPPKLIADRLSISDQQVLYFDGISGYHTNKDGTVAINRLITTYQRDQWGSPDQTFLDVNTLAQTMYSIRFLKQKITSTYPRSALADTNPNGLQGIVTPDDMRDLIVHGYTELVADGVVENLNVFRESLIVERNISNPNRLDVFLPLDVVNQLRIVAVNATVYQQLPQAA